MCLFSILMYIDLYINPSCHIFSDYQICLKLILSTEFFCVNFAKEISSIVISIVFLLNM